QETEGTSSASGAPWTRPGNTRSKRLCRPARSTASIKVHPALSKVRQRPAFIELGEKRELWPFPAILSLITGALLPIGQAPDTDGETSEPTVWGCAIVARSRRLKRF